MVWLPRNVGKGKGNLLFVCAHIAGRKQTVTSRRSLDTHKGLSTAQTNTSDLQLPAALLKNRQGSGSRGLHR